MEELNEKYVRDLIIKLGLTDTIIEIYDEHISDEIIAEELGYSWSKPYSILELPAEDQQEYQVDKYIPLLSINSTQIIAYDLDGEGYIKYDVEQGLADLTCYTWDGVLLEELTFWWENEVEDEDIEHIAKKIGLKHYASILKSLEEHSEAGLLSTFEAQKIWFEKMYKEFNLKK